jgi:hypothetical protein
MVDRIIAALKMRQAPDLVIERAEAALRRGPWLPHGFTHLAISTNPEDLSSPLHASDPESLDPRSYIILDLRDV